MKSIPFPSRGDSGDERRLSARELRAQLGNLAPQMTVAAELAPPRAPEMAASGIAALDAIAGGLPRGAVTQVTGGLSSGRTSLLLAAMAAATGRGEVCALIDVMDAFDPESAQAAGVDLRRVLWIRCNGVLPRREETGARFAANDFGGHDFVAATKRQSRREQRFAPLYNRLEQALRVTDLLLQGGGFGIVALDLAGLPAEVARRVPMTSWFRFRRAVENSPTSLLILSTDELTAQDTPAGAIPCAALAVRLGRREALRAEIESAGPSFARLLQGLEIGVEFLRLPEAKRKPAASVRFSAEAQTSVAGR